MTPTDRQRLDKWLWFARMARTRTAAAQLVADGHVRLNGQRVAQAAKAVRPGDVLTVALARDVRLLRIVATGDRRGPYEEARQLYEDIAPDGAAP
ncbi:MAG: RNA-binding S4 domain-containing protein [Methylobacteriaceae bacterium]|nr:RNA-binding S4 domain-containing protein [Methylobacteriaceae bacterium]